MVSERRSEFPHGQLGGGVTHGSGYVGGQVGGVGGGILGSCVQLLLLDSIVARILLCPSPIINACPSSMLRDRELRGNLGMRKLKVCRNKVGYYVTAATEGHARFVGHNFTGTMLLFSCLLFQHLRRRRVHHLRMPTLQEVSSMSRKSETCTHQECFRAFFVHLSAR